MLSTYAARSHPEPATLSTPTPPPNPPPAPRVPSATGVPDRAARRAVTAVFLANGMAVSSFIARIPDVQTSLGLGEAVLGLVLPGVSIGVITGLTISGRVIPRSGSRRLLLTGATITAVLLPLAGLAPAAWLLAATLVVLGAGSSMMDVGMNAQGVGIERGFGRSIIVGMHAAWSVGTLIGALGGTLATATATSVPVHLSLVAVAFGALTAVAARWLRVADHAEPGAPARFAIARGPLLPLALVAFAAALGEGAAANWSGIHLRDTVEVSAGRVGWGYVAYTAAMVSVRLVGDRLTARFGRRRVVTGGGLLAACGFGLVAGVPVLPLALLGFAMVGLGLGSTVPLAFAAGGRVARTPGEGVAAIASVAYLAFLVGPPVVGYLAEHVSLAAGFTLVAVVVAGLTARRLPVD